MLDKIKGIKKFFCKDNFVKTKLVIALIVAILLAVIFEYVTIKKFNWNKRLVIHLIVFLSFSNFGNKLFVKSYIINKSKYFLPVTVQYFSNKS